MVQESLELARKVVDVAAEGLAEDTVVLGMREVSSFCDYFVICQGRSPLHLEALYGRVVEKLKEEGWRPNHREGDRNATWIVLDYGGVIVHLFDEETRRFYDLEGLWADAEVVDVNA